MEISIKLSNNIQKFLDRYFDETTPIEERFWRAVGEGSIILKGKGFALAFEKKTCDGTEVDEELAERQRVAREQNMQE